MSYLNEYLQAVENEICNDVRAYQLNLEKPEDFNYLPRPGKWLSRTKKNKKMIFLIGTLLRQIWIFGGALCYFSFEFVFNFKAFLRFSNRRTEVLKFDEYALGFSARALEIINTSSIGRTPKSWIVLPWTGIPTDEKLNVFSLYSILSPSDFFKAWLLSIQSIYILYKSTTTRPSLLQGYTAYRWFLTRLGLAHLEQGHFLTSEHFDRWTILIDAVVRNLRINDKVDSTVSLVQHGVLGSLTSAADQQPEVVPFEVKNKLTEVRHLYVYDELSAKIFQQSILHSECSAQVHFFKPQIVLQETLKKKGQLRILFVGHPICEDLHIFIFSQLLKSHSIRAFYKPHPTSAPRREIGDLDWELISDKSYFPAVDLLISYPSTLVTEYSNKNIPAVQHPINLNPESAEPYLSQLRAEISKISL